MEVTGLRELDKALGLLEKKIARKVLRKALRTGAKIVQRKAKESVPVKTGTLKKNIKVRAGRSRKGRICILVGAGKKWYVGDAFYAAFLEFGTKKMKPHPYMQKAYEATKTQALTAVIEGIKTGIEQATAEARNESKG